VHFAQIHFLTASAHADGVSGLESARDDPNNSARVKKGVWRL
jgi:hypothetical protein